jgi:hypothetical protein
MTTVLRKGPVFSVEILRVSVWLDFNEPTSAVQAGHPQQNGRHERMHLTLKKEATRPPGFNSLQQQARFDAFLREFNAERPHEALAMKCPAELYTASARSYAGLPELTYPFHDRDVVITACGRLCLHRKRINISTVLPGQKLGMKEVDEGIWLASFMHYDLGYFDLEQKTLQPLHKSPRRHWLMSSVTRLNKRNHADANGDCNERKCFESTARGPLNFGSLRGGRYNHQMVPRNDLVHAGDPATHSL